MSDPHVSLTTAVNYVYDRFGNEEFSEFTKDQVRQIILNYALEWFSAYYPLRIPFVLDASDPNIRVPNRQNWYRLVLPSELTIRNVEPGNHNSGKFDYGVGGLVYGAPTSFGNTHLAMQMSLDQLTADTWSSLRMPDVVNFHPPNMIEVIAGNSQQSFGSTGSFLTKYALYLCCTHSPDLSTIHPNLFDKIFLNICWIQVRIFLYPLRKRFENMSTPFGEIIMGLADELASAAGELKEQEELLKEQAPKSRRRKVYVA